MKPPFMHMSFHIIPQDTVLFKSWNITDAITMLWACGLVIVAGVLLEVIKYCRWRIEKEQKIRDKIVYEPYSARLFSPMHIAQSLLFLLQLSFSYILMLIFMTFSVWLGIAVVTGLAIGHFTFGLRTETVN